MRFRSYTYLLATIAVLSACQKEEPVYTVGEADNVISLSAGAYEGESDMATKAVPVEDDTRHGKHLALAEGIKLRLQVNGTWTGKSDISKTTTATIGAENGTTKHNGVTFTDAEKLYWDDYGTADPANAGTGNGREKGLTIYGVAVNDKNVSAQPETINWGSFDWSVSANQTDGWSAKDLIISNNLQTGTGYDGTLTFDDFKKKLAGTSGYENAGLLEFKHAMSKITINLTANKGFPQSGSGLVGNTTSKFEGTPDVVLTKFKTGESGTDYVGVSGNVNITDGSVSVPTSYSSVTTWTESVPTSGTVTVVKSALIVPGTIFGTADNDVIAKLTADGNVYYITAQKIREKLTEVFGSEDGTRFTAKSGYNYILNVTVDKTEVHVSATIVDWADVNAENDTPKIDVTTSYGSSGTPFPKDGLSFYYSKAKDDPSIDKYGVAVGDYYANDRLGTNSSGTVTLNAPLYWPNHTIKYFFRGVWPVTKTDGSADSPAVKAFTDTQSASHQGILVSNSPYVSGSFPSDLMLGMPKVSNPVAGGPQDEGDGISATEGTVTLNFTYRMAQVEVRLVSSGEGEDDNVDFGSEGGDDLAEVSITNVRNSGYILLADGSMKYDTNAYDTYQMTPKSSTLTGVTIPSVSDYTDAKSGSSFDWTTDAHKVLVRHDAIIPQSLTSTSPLQFKIKTGSSASGYDTYYIDIKDIDVTTAGQGTSKITEWEAGKHYIYTLSITKTKVTIKATITDWIPVVAGGDFWL